MKRTPLQRRARAKRSPEQRARRAAHDQERSDAWWDFENRVRNATPRGYGDCVGTPWCPTTAPHRGVTAHHKHQRSLGGSDATTNGVWVCKPGHSGIHDNIAEATALGLLASRSDPWPAKEHTP